MKTLRCVKHGLLAGFALAAFVASAAPFEPLFQLKNLEGICQVRKPGQSEFEPATKNKAYPYGTVVRTGPKSALKVLLSSEDFVLLGADTQVLLHAAEDGSRAKIVRLDAGLVNTDLSTSSDTDPLLVDSPVGRFSALTGKGELLLTQDATAFTLVAVASAGGSLALTGPQFAVPQLKSGHSLRVITQRDLTMTRILNVVGDFSVNIDNGSDTPVELKTSSHSAVKIWRERAPKGGRLIVSVFATGPDGKGKENFAFAVGQDGVRVSDMLQAPEETTATNDPFATPDAATSETPAPEAPATEATPENLVTP